MNVLLHEQNDLARTALELVLALRGYDVEVCYGQTAFMKRIQESTFDMALWGMSGGASSKPAFLQRLRQARADSAAVLIGIVDEQELHSLPAMVNEVFDCIVKGPLDVEMLDRQLAAIEQKLNIQPAEAGTTQISRASNEVVFNLIRPGLELGLLLDAAHKIQFITTGIESFTRYKANFYHDRSIMSLLHSDDEARVAEALQRGEDDVTVPARIVGDRDSIRWFDLQFVRVTTARNTAALFVAGRRATRRHLEEQPAILPDNTRDELIAHIDAQGRVDFCTGAMAELLGMNSSRQKPALDRYIVPEDRPAFHECIDNLPPFVGGQRRCIVRFQQNDGRCHTLELVCTNLLGVSAIDAIIVNAADVTHRKSVEQHLMQRAFLDPLTGLPNRGFFLYRLDRALMDARETDTGVAVLFLDLDRFKRINDSLGHEVGDQLLAALGQRLRAAVRPGDIVARFGGDEMIVLLEEINQINEAVDVAKRIIDGIRNPLPAGDYDVSVTACVGIAMSDIALDDAGLMIRNADIALYRAKEQGANRYVVFDEAMAEHVLERLELENGLRNALDNDELEIEFLPELHLQTGRLVALEVLTRWRHQDKGQISPVEFLDVAEESGLIVRLGRWALTLACRNFQEWQQRHPNSERITIALNMSVREFQQPDIVEFLVTTLAEYGIDPTRVRLEIDERSLAVEPEDTFDKVQRLQALGMRFAIDNFGKGFSSLSLFSQFSFDVLKVDRQFTSGNGKLASNLSIVHAATLLAHALGMRVSAEGIETREQLASIQAAGCDYGQGFLFSRSLSAAKTEALFLMADKIEAA